MKSKITLMMPTKAAQKISENPDAFLAHLKANGFPVDSLSVENIFKAPQPCGYYGEVGTHQLGYCPLHEQHKREDKEGAAS